MKNPTKIPHSGGNRGTAAKVKREEISWAQSVIEDYLRGYEGLSLYQNGDNGGQICYDGSAIH